MYAIRLTDEEETYMGINPFLADTDYALEIEFRVELQGDASDDDIDGDGIPNDENPDPYVR